MEFDALQRAFNVCNIVRDSLAKAMLDAPLVHIITSCIDVSINEFFPGKKSKTISSPYGC